MFCPLKSYDEIPCGNIQVIRERPQITFAIMYLFYIFLQTLRVYSHQESPQVHLLWSGPNTFFFVCLFDAVHFHTALFASEPEIVNKTTHVLRSSIHWFIYSTVPEFVWKWTETTSSGTVVWSAPECDCCIHTCPKDPHQRGKRT